MAGVEVAALHAKEAKLLGTTRELSRRNRAGYARHAGNRRWLGGRSFTTTATPGGNGNGNGIVNKIIIVIGANGISNINKIIINIINNVIDLIATRQVDAPPRARRLRSGRRGGSVVGPRAKTDRLPRRRGAERMVEAELTGLRCAVYARFSSEGQREASIEDQVRRCRDFIESRGGTFDERLVFADRGVSGASMDRSAFSALSALATLNPPGVEVIVAEDLSRVGRDQADLHHFRRSLEYSRVRLMGVADGIDTAAAHGMLTFGMKGLVAEVFRRELSDKTRRGLDGRALAGFATGGVAYGYRLRKETSGNGKAIGSVIEIDEEQATVVRRIFGLYLEGHSLSGIAAILNKEGVSPPRVHVSGRRRGWKDSTVRAFLHNESYRGTWKYKCREWRKVPGKNKRRPAPRPESAVIVQDRPHLRVVDEDTWVAVEQRLASVRRHYKGKKSPGESSVPNRRSTYLFSSLLYCGSCGSKMTISGGGSASYYRCEAHMKRGTCKNGLSVKEVVVRESLLDEIRRRLTREDGLLHARKRIAERLGEMLRERSAERTVVQTRMQKTQAQIERLVDAIADGEASGASVKDRLKVLEAQVAQDRRTLEALDRKTVAPITLPTPEKIIGIVFEMDRRLRADPTRGREELRQYFEDGRIDLIPQPGGFYIARSKLLPLVALMQPPSVANQGGRIQDADAELADQIPRVSASSCAGRI